MNYLKVLEQKADKANELLDIYAPSGDVPPLLKEAMMYSLKAGGKRIRPVLLLEVSDICGGPAELAYPLAAAIEMIHTYSLIHDDLPAMDNDDLRRGKPTNHVVYGEAMAILAGDALLNCAMQTITQNIPYNKFYHLKDYLTAANEIICAAGHNGMIAGQVMDMLSEGGEPDPSVLEYIHKHKTGALIRSAVRAGAILSGCTKDTQNALTLYAEAVGLAFQLVDDILDIKGDKGKMGKSAGKDAGAKKLTYPLIYGLDETHKKIRSLYKDAVKSIENLNINTEFLINTADFICNRDY